MRLLTILLTLIALALPPAAAAQASHVPIEQRLTAAQMRATGLDTLSREQLQALNAVLGDEQAVVEQRVEQSTRSRLVGLLDRKEVEPVRAAIKGEFRGWVPGRVIELENGQRWRVTEGELHLRRPIPGAVATVVPGMVSGWYLQVDGQSPRAKVKPLP